MQIFIEKTKQWVEKFVIGLNVCPFAKLPFSTEKIEYIVFEKTDLNLLTEMLIKALRHLAATPASETETTLIIIPNTLQDFEDYLNYVDFTEQMLAMLHLEGVIQIASFHPDYCFDGVDKNDVTNYTNRSPYPMLHLLREESVTWAVEHYPDVDEIPERNMEKLEAMGLEKVQALLKG
jgi:uncharacterized protein